MPVIKVAGGSIDVEQTGAGRDLALLQAFTDIADGFLGQKT